MVFLKKQKYEIWDDQPPPQDTEHSLQGVQGVHEGHWSDYFIFNFQPSFLFSQYECHHWFQAPHIDLVFIAGAFLSRIAVAIVVASTNRTLAHLSQIEVAWGSSRNEILYFTRCCDPPPQVWLQELHSVQGVQAGQGPAWIGFKISSSSTCGMWMRRQLRRWSGRLSDSPRALEA